MKATMMFLMAGLCAALCMAEPQVNEISLAQGGTVYVCTGGYAKRYHKTMQCRGLGSCKDEIAATTVAEAEKAGKTLCKMCYR